MEETSPKKTGVNGKVAKHDCTDSPFIKLFIYIHIYYI
jgi:hypothetical protein